MANSATDITDTDLYPAFDSKADYLDAVEEATRSGERSQHRDVLYRLSNTDTGAWPDPTARHDD